MILFAVGYVLGVATPLALFYAYTIWIQNKYQPH